MNKKFVSLFIAVSSLAGCDNRPAPTPTPNPDSHIIIKLKITAENSGVNRVEVFSNWVVSNLSCAPISYPAGNERIKQVNTPEKVEKVGDYYIATIVMDRFSPDNCHWVNGGSDVKFFRDNYLLSSDGVNADVLRGERVDVLTCLTRPFASVGVCGQRINEAHYKEEDKNAFNATVELIK
ncbi:hypothetical protein [Burkholderia gladioli]|uniref:hypothetical protein n=1 Tax=Burkholderia gladioli TaxID=28095 RepID=UPI00163FFA1E|nr:hypothetical protein [Burkholderia gladioli]